MTSVVDKYYRRIIQNIDNVRMKFDISALLVKSKEHDSKINDIENDISLVYEAEVKTDTESFRYIGLCEGDFKTRYNTHMLSFRNKKYSNSTELSKKIRTLKNDNIKHTVSWKTVQTTRARKCGSDRCNLCLAEKFHILASKNNGLLTSVANLYLNAAT